jgi:hypothetical protein
VVAGKDAIKEDKHWIKKSAFKNCYRYYNGMPSTVVPPSPHQLLDAKLRDLYPSITLLIIYVQQSHNTPMEVQGGGDV